MASQRQGITPTNSDLHSPVTYFDEISWMNPDIFMPESASSVSHLVSKGLPKRIKFPANGKRYSLT